ncbi:hypothetical protein FM106_18640 [Brachybacterium faecium]|nr:hypothetical protein FM106_18640 [Brachybacterium faecium]
MTRYIFISIEWEEALTHIENDNLDNLYCFINGKLTPCSQKMIFVEELKNTAWYEREALDQWIAIRAEVSD